MVRFAVLALLAAGCTAVKGSYWDDENACWESGVGWYGGFDACSDDALMALEDPDGTCWYFTCYGEIPSGWTWDGPACQDLPESERDDEAGFPEPTLYCDE